MRGHALRFKHLPAQQPLRERDAPQARDGLDVGGKQPGGVRGPEGVGEVAGEEGVHCEEGGRWEEGEGYWVGHGFE